MLNHNLVYGKRSFLVPILLTFLLVTTTTATLNSSVYFASYGTIDYSTFSEAHQESELRGVLVKYLSQFTHDDNLICSTLSSYGINAVYVEVNPFMWTGDDLVDFQSMIDACDTYGLSFHALVKYGGYDSSYTQDYDYPSLGGSNPDWRAIDVNSNYLNTICLQRASTRARLKNVIELMVSAFPKIVDINHDYIRYLKTDLGGTDISKKYCYCNECKAAFDAWLAATGKAPVSDATFRTDCAYPSGSRWYDFAEWRVNPVNNIVRDVRQWALAKNPNLIFTADTWTPFIGEWTPDYWKHDIGQDPAFWLSQGWLEAFNPMVYTDSMTSLTNQISETIQYHIGASKGIVPLVPFITQGGPGADVGEAVSIAFWLQEIDYLRQQGCNGFIIWRYGGPGFSETGTPFTDIRPYLAAIRDRRDGGKAMFQTFEQSSLIVSGAQITWTTSLPTTGKVEYSTSPLFRATPIAKPPATFLPYVDMDYSAGTIVSETTPNTNHLLDVPLNPPFYFRIRDADSNVELAGPVYLVTE